MTGWQYIFLSLTTLQCIGLAAFPFSFVSLTLGSMDQQFLKQELKYKSTLKAKASVSPFFLVIAVTKVWIVADTMCSVHMIHPYLSPLPLMLLLAIQLILSLKMGINLKESIYCSVGNLSSIPNLCSAMLIQFNFDKYLNN